MSAATGTARSLLTSGRRHAGRRLGAMRADGDETMGCSPWRGDEPRPKLSRPCVLRPAMPSRLGVFVPRPLERLGRPPGTALGWGQPLESSSMAASVSGEHADCLGKNLASEKRTGGSTQGRRLADISRMSRGLAADASASVSTLAPACRLMHARATQRGTDSFLARGVHGQPAVLRFMRRGERTRKRVFSQRPG